MIFAGEPVHFLLDFLPAEIAGHDAAVYRCTAFTATRCKYRMGRIQFCSLHARAENLLAVVEHLGKISHRRTMANEKDEIMGREVILPYLKERYRTLAERHAGDRGEAALHACASNAYLIF